MRNVALSDSCDSEARILPCATLAEGGCKLCVGSHRSGICICSRYVQVRRSKWLCTEISITESQCRTRTEHDSAIAVSSFLNYRYSSS